jgi:hypothetical protein
MEVKALGRMASDPGPAGEATATSCSFWTNEDDLDRLVAGLLRRRRRARTVHRPGSQGHGVRAEV